MKKYIISLSFLLISNLFAYVDSDFDGVEDSEDKCINTPFSDIVNNDGCTIKSLIKVYNYDIIIGIGKSITTDNTDIQTNSTLSTLQLDFFHNNFTYFMTSVYIDSKIDFNDNSINEFYDTQIGLKYRYQVNQKIELLSSLEIILPTSNQILNNKTDVKASLKFDYKINNFNLFTQYQYTAINNNSTDTIKYQNISGYSMGLGSNINSNNYISTIYTSESSMIKSYDKTTNISLNGYYKINQDKFITYGYTYGLDSNIDYNYTSISFGYKF